MARSAGRVLEMEGIRGVAVMLVFFVHFGQLFGDLAGGFKGIVKFLETIGHSGVDLFFLLSGYLIYGVLLRRPSLRVFLLRRAQRIYPAFLVVFAAYLGASTVFPSHSKLPAEAFAAALFLLNNVLLLPGIFDLPLLITVAWSLSYEFFSYLAFPLLIYGLGMPGWSTRRRVAFWLVVAAFLVVCAAAFHDTNWAAVRVKPWKHVRLVMFIGGAVLYELQKSGWLLLSRHEPFVLLGCAAAALVVIVFSNRPGGDFICAIAVLVASGSFVALVLTAGGVSGRLMRVAPLRWLGNMSYSYYLAHVMPLHLIKDTMAYVHWRPSPIGLVLVVLPCAFFLSLVAGALLYLTVEKPLSIEPATARKRRGETLATSAGQS